MSDSSRKGQLELGINRSPEKDRNFHLGGRSFYFFDFDDNIAFLTTPLILFHKNDRSEVQISSGDFAQYHQSIGKSGPYADYKLDFCDMTGTFRNFRDVHIDEVEKLQGKKQIFVQDVAAALGFPDFQWKGPSWECFYHAAFNQRPVSVITARGHHPETLKDGIRVFVQNKLLPLEPNYLSIYPVSHKETRLELGDLDFTQGTAELKQRAIRASVEKAIELYGYNPHHRFGMSDDDPKNIQLIVEEMTRLKARFPEMSFFMIETQHGNFIKHEVKLGGLRGEKVENLSQLSFFEEDRQKS
ncbi:hypothetical protein [Bdellovibrio sp. HCB-162]|uniref:hypothetical protein n=1 Tax=Bdellovibrio sp. HCB-162 TaxID=3394234 RepID=UPI0039BC7824